MNTTKDLLKIRDLFYTAEMKWLKVQGQAAEQIYILPFLRLPENAELYRCGVRFQPALGGTGGRCTCWQGSFYVVRFASSNHQGGRDGAERI